MRESHRWICNSWERGTESEANAPEDGRILNRVYENKYFGFSIRLPAGWCLTDRASFVALQLRKNWKSRAANRRYLKSDRPTAH